MFVIKFSLLILFLLSESSDSLKMGSESRHKTEVEVEWLLDQLITILSKFASEIETAPTLLESRVFRSVLIRILIRITEVIERVENMPNISTRMSATITRLDAIRITISNFVSNYITSTDVSNSWTTAKTSTDNSNDVSTDDTSEVSEGPKKVYDLNQVMDILSDVMSKLQQINDN